MYPITRDFNPALEQMNPDYVHISRAQFATMICKSIADLDRRRKEDPRCPKGFTTSKNPLSPKVVFVLSECYAYSKYLIEQARYPTTKVDQTLLDEVSSAAM